jgi:hypothetical protein
MLHNGPVRFPPFHFDADPDPTFHPVADPDLYPFTSYCVRSVVIMFFSRFY